MKIWKEFGSSHSGNVSVIGHFNSNENAKEAIEMIEDFTLGQWEERHESVEEFLEIWSEKYHPDLKYCGINDDDYEIGVDNEPDIEISGNTISITRLRSKNVSGILKLLLFAGANNTEVKQ